MQWRVQRDYPSGLMFLPFHIYIAMLGMLIFLMRPVNSLDLELAVMSRSSTIVKRWNDGLGIILDLFCPTFFLNLNNLQQVLKILLEGKLLERIAVLYGSPSLDAHTPALLHRIQLP